MLKDVRLINQNSITLNLASVISGGKGVTRLQQGVYELGHWNFELETPDIDRKFEHHYDDLPDGIGVYGVCDNIEQLLSKIPLTIAAPEPFCIAMVRIRKDEQSESGGWRWHKWGEYIGTQDPQCEHLYDEPKIEQVFTFHVYRLKPSKDNFFAA